MIESGGDRESERERGGGGQRKKEETIWTEVGEFQSAGRKKEASWDSQCVSVCVLSFM